MHVLNANHPAVTHIRFWSTTNLDIEFSDLKVPVIDTDIIIPPMKGGNVSLTSLEVEINFALPKGGEGTKDKTTVLFVFYMRGYGGKILKFQLLQKKCLAKWT